jgi:hypothetical protein
MSWYRLFKLNKKNKTLKKKLAQLISDSIEP